jgi:quercetin 2,3-dioxygenase
MKPCEIRRDADRGSMSTGWLEARFSFNFASYDRPDRTPFGVLLALNEDRVQPGTGFPMHGHRDLEILMVPLEGVIEHADSLGNLDLVHPDEVMYMAAGAGIMHSQMNPSQETVDRHLQVWLQPLRRSSTPRAEKRHFDRARRSGMWQLLASGDGRQGSLMVDQQADVWRTRLAPEGRPLHSGGRPGRSAYLHVIDGEISLRDGAGNGLDVLRRGDAAAWPLQQAFSVAAEGGGHAELLLLELPAVTSA